MELSTQPALDEERKECFRLFLLAHSRILAAIDRELEAGGHVPLAWYDVLVTLEDQGDHGLRMCDLADQVLLSRSGLTRLVDRLVANGLVARAVCDKDRRVAYARLTSKGLAVRESAWPVVAGLIQELFGRHLTDMEARLVRGLLTKVAGDSVEPGA